MRNLKPSPNVIFCPYRASNTKFSPAAQIRIDVGNQSFQDHRSAIQTYKNAVGKLSLLPNNCPLATRPEKLSPQKIVPSLKLKKKLWSVQCSFANVDCCIRNLCLDFGSISTSSGTSILNNVVASPAPFNCVFNILLISVSLFKNLW